MSDESISYRPNPKISVVVLTYNCAAWISRTLVALTALPEEPNIIVVDNGSRDKTIEIIEQSFPLVEIIRLSTNIGAAARNQGVRYAQTPYVAFCDDDTWWAPGSLKKAVDLYDRYDNLALINAKIAIGEAQRVDSISEKMARSPMPPRYGLPGHTLLSFMAGASAVRREAFLQVGGYDARLFLGGEEEIVGCDLVVAGWEMRYIPEVIVHHYPSNQSSTNLRHYGIRNTLWFAWRRRPWCQALSWTFYIARTAPKNLSTVRGFYLALRGLPWAMRDHRVVPREVENQLKMLDRQKRTSEARRYK